MNRSLLRTITRAGFALIVGILGASALAPSLPAADFLQFRGNDCDGIGDGPGPASLDKVGWTAPLPGKGISGPIVVGDRVYVTCCSGYLQDRLHVLAFQTADGKPIWERQFWATGRTQCHSSMSVASSTPASDGRRLVALFSSNDLACLDLDGRLLWFRGLTYEFPNASNSLGMASSPVIVDDTVIAQIESDDDSFAIGIDADTGLQRWKVNRPRSANWSSPIILRHVDHGADLVVLQSAKGLVAIRPKTGEIVWTYEDSASTIPSSTAGHGMIFVPSHGLTALAANETPGNKAAMKWRQTPISPGTPSPVFLHDRIYTLTGAAVLVAADAKDGKLLWRSRLKGGFTSSPIVANGKLYAFSDAGVGQLVKLGDKSGQVVSEHDFKEKIFATPAVCGNAVYIRSDQHLWKLAD